MADENEHGRTGGLVPRPDPTLLTTQQLIREVAALKELIFTRLSAMDKGVELLQAKADRQPSIDEVVARMEGQFRAVELRFEEREKRCQQASASNKAAIDAALAAQKESVREQNLASSTAIAKAESATAKEIDSLKSLMALERKSNDDRTADTRNRLTTIESSSNSQGRMFALIATGIVVVAALVAIATAFLGT